MTENITIQTLIGKTLITAAISNGDKDRIDFETDNGEKYIMYHSQNCCESVTVDDICGDLSDLIGNPILKAEERTSDKNPDGITKDYQDSFTWTFYELATIKGSVTIRWYGSSNGYYSESVTFDKAHSWA